MSSRVNPPLAAERSGFEGDLNVSLRRLSSMTAVDVTQRDPTGEKVSKGESYYGQRYRARKFSYSEVALMWNFIWLAENCR